jgi:hypothetical protein
MNRYKLLKQESQWEILQANKKYMEDVSSEYKNHSKKIWSYIKSKGQEWEGVAPLKNKKGYLKSDNSMGEYTLLVSFYLVPHFLSRGRRGRDRIVVGFTATYAISTYYHCCCEIESRSGRGVEHFLITFVRDLR